MWDASVQWSQTLDRSTGWVPPLFFPLVDTRRSPPGVPSSWWHRVCFMDEASCTCHPSASGAQMHRSWRDAHRPGRNVDRLIHGTLRLAGRSAHRPGLLRKIGVFCLFVISGHYTRLCNSSSGLERCPERSSDPCSCAGGAVQGWITPRLSSPPPREQLIMPTVPIVVG